MSSLYELTAEYQDALAELTDLDDEAVVDTLDALKGELEVKATNVAKYCENIKATIVAMKEAEKRMANRRKILDNKVARIMDYLKRAMEASKISRIETPEFVLAIKNNPPKVEIEDEELIPEDFWKEKIIRTVDKTAVKKSLLNGGCSGATLVRGTRLEVK